MENIKIKVYAKINENNIVTAINSSIFLNSIEGYTQIDEGSGDKYAHAQGNYLEKSLIDESGRFNYKFEDGKILELTEEEKETLFPPTAPQITEQERLNSQLLQSNAQQQLVNAQILKQIAELKGVK